MMNGSSVANDRTSSTAGTTTAVGGQVHPEPSNDYGKETLLLDNMFIDAFGKILESNMADKAFRPSPSCSRLKHTSPTS
jgi:hypothetical protein